MKRASHVHGFKAQRRPRHSYRLLDVWGPSGMTRWLAIGTRDALRVDIPPEVATVGASAHGAPAHHARIPHRAHVAAHGTGVSVPPDERERSAPWRGYDEKCDDGK